MSEAVICEPVRTPIGRYGGMFASLTAVDLGVAALQGLLARTGIPADAVQDDRQALCDTYALAHLPAGAQPAQVVISLADRPVPFGQARPDAVQFFEAYRPEGAACVWEMF